MKETLSLHSFERPIPLFFLKNTSETDWGLEDTRILQEQRWVHVASIRSTRGWAVIDSTPAIIRTVARNDNQHNVTMAQEARERVWFSEHVLHPTLCIKPFGLLLIRCPHGTVLQDMVGLDHMAVGMDVDVAVGVESRRDAPRSIGSARSAALGTGESYGLQTLCECHERQRGSAVDLDPGEDCSPGEVACWYGQRRAYFSWQESSGKKLEKHQKKLNVPKKTAKHIEANQNWVNRKSKRIETESAKLAEMQENLRVRKETLRVAYDEIKILREELVREGESMDKNKSHIMSRRTRRKFGSSNNKNWLSGWTRDGRSPAGRWKHRDSR